MKRKLLVLFLGTILLSMQVIAQQITVTGKVTSANENLPLSGVSVKVKGKTGGTTTDSGETMALLPKAMMYWFSALSVW